MMYGLLVPAGGGEPLPLLKTTVIVGRRAECDVVIPAKSVSGRHCRLEFVDNVWRVIDLDSHNGTGVDGRRCKKARIMPGQVLHVAKQRFHIDYPNPDGEPQGDDDLALQFLQGSDPDVDSVQPGPAAMPGDQSHLPPSSNQPELPVGIQPPSLIDGPLGTLLPAGGGQPIPLSDSDLIVGRSRRCDVRIDSGTISSKHCRLQFISGYWVAEDLGSSNGIRVDGIRFKRKCIMPGSELSLSRESFILDYIPGDGVPPVVHEPFGGAQVHDRRRRKSLLEKAGLSSRDVESINEDENAIPDRKIYSLDDDDE